MARIIVGSWMVRYPLGGNLSWTLQYLVGLTNLGHDVYLVEKYAYNNSCYNPVKKVMSNDCSYGTKVVSDLLSRFGLMDKWCFVQKGGVYHGLSKQKINEVFRTADLYIDIGAHNRWAKESSSTLRVFIDVDPAFTQIKWHNQLMDIPLPVYDHYYTIGMNVGREGNVIPTSGITWKYIYNPVNTHMFSRTFPAQNASYTTIMNWQSYECITYNGISYGQKDIEFEKFMSLPQLVDAAMEIAVHGLSKTKAEIIHNRGWVINAAQEVTSSYDAFCKYLANSKGEFSVCKNVYVATSSGWFSDRSAAYLASGRPVVVQDTGFKKHLPVGEGLFAVTNLDEAQAAIGEIESNYSFHSQKAWEIASEYLEASKVLKNFLNELGM
jgi:hypothetical protein